ncbi:DUF4917 family protein [Rhodopirellula sp. JC740]|uniref:DUF4917 family protein n=1 Tax=Rhodopirellula halodulae TaxID=2894198 RepID=A0ABS8NHI6_9BACT|nr:DUF4917 family protein [Rhodopirellula sp. JC740]MCC9643007.1 DUF4917 family protein [Rhodopirellula sp. JC740]
MAKKKSKKAAPRRLLSFADAVKKSDEVGGRRHLLLGNGFSISLFPTIFTYGTLFDRAKKSGNLPKRIQEVFDLLGTTDFEKVMEALQIASQMVQMYSKKSPKLAAKLAEDAAKLRDVLADTISANHPERPHEIAKEQYASCKRFLTNFENGSIYTLNYDLLLYWTLMQSEVQPDVSSDDGFRDSENGEDYVVWEVQNSDRQRVFYLHGALHIYDAGHELKKFVWSKTEIALVDQIRQSLAKREYPIVVTEGTAEQKLDRIQHSGFLNRAYRSFSSIGGSLFIYGHSLAPNDEHLLELIDNGKLKAVFVGIYGNPDSATNKEVIRRAMKFSTRRGSRRPVDVHFYDAASAQVWDGEPDEEEG